MDFHKVALDVSKLNSVAEQADKELKAFQKIKVPAGGSVNVTLSIRVQSLAYYNETQRKWIVEYSVNIICWQALHRQIVKPQQALPLQEVNEPERIIFWLIL